MVLPGGSFQTAGSITVNSLVNAGTITVSGTGTSNVVSSATLTNNSTFTKAGTGTMTLAGTLSWGTNVLVNVNGGAVNFAGTGSTGAGSSATVNIGGSGVVNVASSASHFDSGSSFVSLANSGTFNVLSGVSATVGRLTGTGNVNLGDGSTLLASKITGNTLSIGDSAKVTMRESSPNSPIPSGDNAFVNVVKALSINGGSTPTGTLDLGNNDIIIDFDVDAGQIDTVRDQLISGYNFGDWMGTGITSSTASQNPGDYALGMMHSADYLSLVGDVFSGVTIDESAILVKFTWLGDINLNGLIDDGDVDILSINYNPSSSGMYWFNGDLDFDGVVGDSDVDLLSIHYAEPYLSTSLPEPGTIALLLAGAITLAGRPRRKR